MDTNGHTRTLLREMESSEKEVYECIFMHKDPTSIGEAILESKPPNYQPHLKVLINNIVIHRNALE